MSQATPRHWYWRSRRHVAERDAQRAERRAARRYRRPKAPAHVPGWNELVAIANDVETVRVVREYLAERLGRKRNAA